MDLSNLPSELLPNVFGFLSYGDRLNCALVNHEWNYMVRRFCTTKLLVNWQNSKDKLGPALALFGRITLSGITRGDSGAQNIAETLMYYKAPSIVHLDFEWNNVGPEGAKALAEVITNTNVSSINLNHSKIGSVGATAIGAALQSKSCHLRKLAAKSVSMQDDGALAIAKGLAENTSLRELSLCGNRITYTGAMAIAEALTKNTSLVSCDLFDNAISNDGTIALADTLRSNYTLKTLNIAKNNIGEKGLKAMENVMAETKSNRGFPVEVMIKPLNWMTQNKSR